MLLSWVVRRQSRFWIADLCEILKFVKNLALPDCQRGWKSIYKALQNPDIFRHHYLQGLG